MDQQQALELFTYDPLSGELRWKVSRGSVRAGCIAGKRKGEYSQTKIFRKLYYTHRLIWLMHNGSWPAVTIDHINRDKHDNRIENLRLATHQQNHRNVYPSRRNTSGVTGVRWNKQSKRYVSYYVDNGKHVHIGSFESLHFATMARRSLMQELFGEFAS